VGAVMMFRTTFKITRVRLFVVLVMVVCSILGWCRFHSRFTLPKDVKNTPVEGPLRRELSALTADQGWIQTDAVLRNLNKQSAVGDRLELIRSERCPSVEFFSVRLRRYHTFRLRSVSAPFLNLVVAVDAHSGRVWSFQSGGIDRQIIPFLRAVEVSVHNEKDALTLWQLFLCLHPVPLSECQAHRTGENRWCVFSKDPKSLSGLGLCVELDAEHYVESIRILAKGT